MAQGLNAVTLHGLEVALVATELALQSGPSAPNRS